MESICAAARCTRTGFLTTHFHTFTSRHVINGGPTPSLPAMPPPPLNRRRNLSLSPSPPFNFLGQRFKIHRRKTVHTERSPSTSSKFVIRASQESADVPPSSNTKAVIFNSAVTVILGVSNRVLYKLALVPMKEYPFFLAQVTTFGYLGIYFSILYLRYRAGIVTKDMMTLPKSSFWIIGFLEALGVVSGMYAGAMLPGPAIPILSQTFLVWQLGLSFLLLGRTYSLNQITGCLLVAAGVVLAVTSGSGSNNMLSGVALCWPALMIASSAFQAGASIIKESVFINAATRLKGKMLDIFVVNSFGSGFQALFVLLFLPFLSNLKGIPFSELPSFLKSGAGCFFNSGNDTSGCEGAPLLPLLYIITNIAFNISILNLVKISTAVVSSLAVMSSVPLSIYLLSLPMPYLPQGSNLSPFFLLGSLVLIIGLIVYNLRWPVKQNS